MRRRVVPFLFAVSLLLSGKAVAVLLSGSSYNTSAPSGSDIANWSTGWTGANTGWDYVGFTSQGAGGIYLGNGWVLTAGHENMSDTSTFKLGNTTYSILSGSLQEIDGSDLEVFKLDSTTLPSLAALTLATSSPALGSSVVMIGYGDNGGNPSTGQETWGVNWVTGGNIPVQVNSFTSTDFETSYGVTPWGTNTAEVILGDSGGAGFIYNSSTHQWELAGLLEANGEPNDSNSYLIEISQYAQDIGTATGLSVAPEPESWALLVLGMIVVWRAARFRAMPTDPMAK